MLEASCFAVVLLNSFFIIIFFYIQHCAVPVLAFTRHGFALASSPPIYSFRSGLQVALSRELIPSKVDKAESEKLP
uniref:Uncharacterized protein n=1 Tax=Anguilla anguilla TaxID=7936 RepID=A0A0E9PGP9_ANGAN